MVFKLSLNEITQQKGGDGMYDIHFAHVGQVKGILEIRLQRRNADGSVIVLGRGQTRILLPKENSGRAEAVALNIQHAQFAIENGADSRKVDLTTPTTSEKLKDITESGLISCEIEKPTN